MILTKIRKTPAELPDFLYSACNFFPSANIPICPSFMLSIIAGMVTAAETTVSVSKVISPAVFMSIITPIGRQMMLVISAFFAS